MITNIVSSFNKAITPGVVTAFEPQVQPGGPEGVSMDRFERPAQVSRIALGVFERALKWANEHPVASQTAAAGALLLFGLVENFTPQHIGGLEILPVSAGLGSFFKGLFGDGVSDRVEAKLSDRSKTGYQNLGEGERMVRDDLIRRMLKQGVAREGVVTVMAKLFEKAGSMGGASFSALGRLLTSLDSVKIDNERALELIGAVIDTMPSGSVDAFDVASMLISKGWPFEQVVPFLELVKGCLSDAMEHVRDLGPARVAEMIQTHGGDAEAAFRKVKQDAAAEAKRKALAALMEPYERLARTFKNIERLETPELPEYELAQMAYRWLVAGNDLLRYDRRYFWKALFNIMEFVPPQGMGKLLASFMSVDKGIVEALMSYFEHEGRHLKGDLGDIEISGYLKVIAGLTRVGLVAGISEYEKNAPPAEELALNGGSSYVRDILLLLSEGAIRDNVLNIEDADIGEEIKRFFFVILSEYQMARAGHPSMPKDMLISLAAVNSFKRVLQDGAFVQKQPSETIVNWLKNLYRGMPRALARLSGELFERYKAQIDRDFPDAAYYRKGLEQGIDTRAIEEAIEFPEEGERLIMHVGVGSDLQFVKDSLRHLSADGRVVIVDNDEEAFGPFRADPETKAALESGRLVIERTDAFGDGSLDFRRRYQGEATRVYLLHPNGPLAPVAHDVVAEGGLVIYQSDEGPEKTYYPINRDMFLKGDFKKVVGYENGPAWFKTRTAVNVLSDAGIHFLVAKRVKPPRPRAKDDGSGRQNPGGGTSGVEYVQIDGYEDDYVAFFDGSDAGGLARRLLSTDQQGRFVPAGNAWQAGLGILRWQWNPFNLFLPLL